MTGAVFLRKGRAGPAIGRHPWVFAGHVERVEGTPADGDPVAVRKAEDGSFLAHGLFNSKSEIRVRLYSWDESEPVDEQLFGKRIRAAIRYRLETLCVAGDRAAYRVFSSEADGVSGLTVDRYADYLVVQVTSLGLARHVDGIAALFMEILQPEGILLRAVPDMAKREGMELADRVLLGTEPPGPIPILEGDVCLEASLKGGQKTGLFLDQRENRQSAARFAAGRRVLDLFCYTGGFGLHCAKAGAREVIGIDSSEPALKHARRNAEINELAGIRFERDDALNYLRNVPEKSFSMVVVDPPRFATSHLHKERALRMYYKVNMEALRALEPGGVFVTCSCSGRVNPFEWFSLLSSVARKQGRFLRVIEFRGAAPDHPHSPFCPESQYLKCVIAQVE